MPSTPPKRRLRAAGLKIGILGGTFDPIHRGHLRLARAAQRYAALDLVYFVPARRPLHKQPPTFAFEDRFAMVALALAGHPSWIPVAAPETGGPSYSVDEVAAVQALHPSARHAFILGADAFRDLPHWKDAGRLLAMCDFIVAHRRQKKRGKEDEQDMMTAFSDPLLAGLVRRCEPDGVRLQNTAIWWLPEFREPTSSTRVRAQLSGNAARLAEEVPVRVAEYLTRLRKGRG
ncbi:MAG: nicotinate (nicotinamide) nucleotide adenylyltransferase [Terriglobales bacterium]